jgi:hypothetical protein
MSHIYPDYQTKKAFKEALKAGVQIEIFNAGLFPLIADGKTCVEAPARCHKWYAMVEYKNNIVTKIIS